MLCSALCFRLPLSLFVRLYVRGGRVVTEARGNVHGNDREAGGFVVPVFFSLGKMLLESNQDSIPKVRRLLESSLPVRFPDAFYQDLIRGAMASFELYGDDDQSGELIGHISWKLAEPVYLYSLAVDVRHRGEGHGSKLVQHLLDRVEGKICLHVHAGNSEAIRFYSRHGFVRGDLVRNFYPRLIPAEALCMTRN
ncbi:hypothetical protein BASA82_001086 [Batrachochytrium salamandrivorans]|nr:hypothetical protein BASA81_004793 [Batrachochytrium salamandrivorans]KAH9260888.1 hypothetical protein BASA82_001086 [Batrachochytrium salamandrivorans]